MPLVPVVSEHETFGLGHVCNRNTPSFYSFVSVGGLANEHDGQRKQLPRVAAATVFTDQIKLEAGIESDRFRLSETPVKRNSGRTRSRSETLKGCRQQNILRQFFLLRSKKTDASKRHHRKLAHGQKNISAKLSFFSLSLELYVFLFLCECLSICTSRRFISKYLSVFICLFDSVTFFVHQSLSLSLCLCLSTSTFISLPLSAPHLIRTLSNSISLSLSLFL